MKRRRERKMKKEDVESGGGGEGERPLYPSMVENPKLRWSFIRKVYTILLFQLLFTIAVAVLFIVFSRPIVRFFFLSTTTNLVLFFLLLFLPIILLFPLYRYHKKHPLNYFLLFVFTVALAFPTGFISAFVSGEIVVEAVILTAVVVVSLTLYTFWASRRGHDFTFLGPFLFGALLILVVFGLIQIVHPLGKWSTMIYGCLGSIIFSGYIIYDTSCLIKRFSYDDFIWASVCLYLDIINLFNSLLSILNR